MKHPNPSELLLNLNTAGYNRESGSITNGLEIECQDAQRSSRSGRQVSNVNVNAEVFVRASATCKILVLCLVLFFIFAVIVMSRIRSLELRNERLEAQLRAFHITLNEVLVRLPVVPEESNQVPNDSYEESSSMNHDDDDDEYYTSIGKRSQPRIRREVNGSLSLPRSETNGSNEVTSEEIRLRNTRKINEHSGRSKGKSGGQECCRKTKDQIRALKLKLKLANTRRRIVATQYSKVKALPSSSPSFSDSRAIYLIPTAPNVNIKKPEQLIGPWYMGEGSDFGFNDHWYRDISLDQNGTSIIFNENGLHLIYAQVYYHLTIAIGEKPAPMGYRIYIRKNNLDGRSNFRRPIPIAECVPSYPSTFYQTCFTQVAWYLEKGDQLFLEHFANSFPMIEADRQGKTFLGIVRLPTFR